MFAKTAVVGQTAHSFCAALAKASGSASRWNFHKYLVDRGGCVVARFPSAMDPLDQAVTARIEHLLDR